MQKIVFVILLVLASMPVRADLIDQLNEQIKSGGAGLDYLIQDVCTDASDNVIVGDPATCARHRNVRIGEKIPYLRTDYDTINNVTYQALFSYPVPGTDGKLKIITPKSNQTRFNADYKFNITVERDGYDLADVSGTYVSFIRTSDGGCYDQKFSSATGRTNGWISYPLNITEGALTHTTYIDRISPILPSGCERSSRSTNTRTVWNVPHNLGYETGKVLSTIQSYHFAQANLSAQNNALEKFFFTKEYGFTRWEAWMPLSRCNSELTPNRCDPNRADYFLKGRCSSSVSPSITSFGNQTWVRVDCRDNTRYLQLNTALIPLDNNMARINGLIDIDSPSVLNRLPPTPIVTAAKRFVRGSLVLDSGTAASQAEIGSGVFIAMQTDGNLVLYNNGRALWASNTVGACVRCRAVFQGDGNLVIYNRDNWGPVWATDTSDSSAELIISTSAPYLKIQSLSSGSIIYSGTNVFSPFQLLAGQVLYVGKPSAQTKLAMQRDGNVVLYRANVPLWASNTYGRCSECRLNLQGDGNLVVYNLAPFSALWATGTEGRGAYLRVNTTSPYLSILDSSGQVVRNLYW